MTPSSDLRRQLQRELMWLVLLILVVDAAAIGLYYLLGMEERARTPRLIFTIAWLASTLVVVVPRLQRIRALRNEARRRMGRRG